MAEVKWIKIVTDIFDDSKILIIEKMPEAYAIIVAWFKLLCLAGKENNGGVFRLNDRIHYNDELLATIFRMPVNIIRLALKTFEDLGMIEIINGVVTIPNWEKHQNEAKLEEIREYQRLAKRKERDKKQLLLCQGHVVDCQHTDIDIEVDKDKKKNSNSGTSPQMKFIPPTLEEVQSYCKERNNKVDAQKWIDFYSSKGWMIGKNKMKDWKAAVRTWEKSTTQSEQRQDKPTFNNHKGRDYDTTELKRQLLAKSRGELNG